MAEKIPNVKLVITVKNKMIIKYKKEEKKRRNYMLARDKNP